MFSQPLTATQLPNILNDSNKPTRLQVQTPKQTSHPLQRNKIQLALLNKPVNSATYASLLESCQCPELGRQVHAHTIKTGFGGHEFVETKLVQMYSKCGCLEDSCLVFDRMPERNLYSWTAVLGAYVEYGMFEEAGLVFGELFSEGVGLEFFVFPVVLKVCGGIGAVEFGRQVHGIVLKCGFVSNVYVGNALIDMYGKCGSLDEAKKVFQPMPERDCVSWNTVMTACAVNGMVYEALEFLENMGFLDNLRPNLVSWSTVIGGFAQNGYDREAIEVLSRMVVAGTEPNARTLATVLPACARLQDLKLGKEIHGYVVRRKFMSNPFIVNGLVDLYRRCSDTGSANKIFLRFSIKNSVSFNTMIVGYCENGEISKARDLFDQMELVGIKKDIISWNSMISGYADNHLFNEAMDLFSDLITEGIEPDSFTLGSVLTVCADLTSSKLGKELHSYAICRGLQSNPYVGGALVEMYSKCNNLNAAQMAFKEVIAPDKATWNALISGCARCNQLTLLQNLIADMKEDGFEPTVYTWNGIMAGYVENGLYESAIELLNEMHGSNIRPDVYSIGMILTACSKLTSMERGKQIHAHLVRSGYESDVYIGAALLDMYAKCGSIKHALQVYKQILHPNLVTHNAILTAYAMHGYGEEGIDLFRRMVSEGIRPDEVTFLAVLSSCVHAGAVKAGYEFFNLMAYYNVKATLKHYTCIVDLLSRAGQLYEAYELIKKMPMHPDSVTWGALLGGCVIHCNADLGEIAAERLTSLEPSNTSNYVLLANLYAYTSRWSDLARLRQMLKEKGFQKTPGCSWIEHKDDIHVFLSCDRTHKRTDDIYFTLDNLTTHLKLIPTTDL